MVRISTDNPREADRAARRASDANRCEIVGMSLAFIFDEDPLVRSDEAIEPAFPPNRCSLSETKSPSLHDFP